MSADAETEETLGSRIRSARELRGLTLRRLASTTGLSSGFISQLENDRSNASVASLKNLATALGVSTAELIEGGIKESRGVLRRADRRSITMADGLTKFILTKAPLRNLEICTADIEPGGSTGAQHYFHGNSQEFVLCLKGRVELYLADEVHILEPGDSIEYVSSTEHGLRNLDRETAEVLWVVSPPTS
ncbi:helix-turn-helix domain-containing protein [Paeniglutamicibacter cryotolerans]|uniref:Transcriptional regulator with XRE-family HTH domain n=1 Tax=Paeniglutamicibacter cryotolerans TaxID=670079 RepID=A0A839QF07_9MICC|nr:cupin domain-containing protein [Paeniglutamicibacter cryotolerans]MBB2994729.1 transcriptional regulator with XRE-family HTH domain [Paeniglutamicibacter cryotolerans]